MWGGGGFGLLILFVVLGRLACSASVMTYQDSQFKDYVKAQAGETDDPEYWCFLVDEYHDKALSGCMTYRGRTAQYDPEIYAQHLVALLKAQVTNPDTAVVGRFKARYGREPRFGSPAP